MLYASREISRQRLELSMVVSDTAPPSLHRNGVQPRKRTDRSPGPKLKPPPGIFGRLSYSLSREPLSDSSPRRLSPQNNVLPKKFQKSNIHPRSLPPGTNQDISPPVIPESAAYMRTFTNWPIIFSTDAVIVEQLDWMKKRLVGRAALTLTTSRKLSVPTTRFPRA